MYTINLWPILVASIVAFGIGALWYSPMLFGGEWAALTKTTDSDLAEARAGGVWKLYVTQFVVTVISFFILAFIIASTNAVGGSNGAFFGFIVWLGFTATTATSGILWEKKTFKLALIDVVSVLLNLVIGGAIIGAWR
ncbi:DUF1761 family protein [Patescibacteria group bacterium]|nr:DUF1761 family protein [Patescibacteria group bacterium]MDE1946728.1 DUF1761 domain-containing protein [Patescibacteria group bacterium]MDE2010969.1 DUF1761 domain-containing protein [Patescibacteria group bacterium]MDE2232812.1 DUF1761 domain-containing protein [Patescibacteria group bacterium]